MQSIGQQPHSAADKKNGFETGHNLSDDDHDTPLGGPHDYETRVQSYLQSLKAYIENASVRRKWVPGDKDDRG